VNGRLLFFTIHYTFEPDEIGNWSKEVNSVGFRTIACPGATWARQGMPSSEQLSTSSGLSDRTSHVGKRRDARKRPTGYEMISV
jgi:hypothetical protein